MKNEETKGSKPRRKRTASGWTAIAKFVPGPGNTPGSAFYSQTISRASRSPNPSPIKDWLIQHGIKGELPDGFDIFEWKKQYGFLEEGEERPDAPKGKKGAYPEFGDFLRTVREKVLKMSRARVGELVNTSAGHILRWENGFKPVKSTQWLLFDLIINVCDEDLMKYNDMPAGWLDIIPLEYKTTRKWVAYTDDAQPNHTTILPPRFADIVEDKLEIEAEPEEKPVPYNRKKTLRTKAVEEDELAKITERKRLREIERQKASKDRERQIIRIREALQENDDRIAGLVSNQDKLVSKLDWIMQQVSENNKEEKDQNIKNQQKYITLLEEKVKSLEEKISDLEDKSPSLGTVRMKRLEAAQRFNERTEKEEKDRKKKPLPKPEPL